MELSYKQLETTLAAYFQINPDRLGTFRSRIKQLQRLEFPSGVNIGRGLRMVYTGEHLFKMAAAFELIGSGLPADRATKIVEAHWEQFSAAYALGQRDTITWNFKNCIYVRLVIRTLADIQFSRTGPADLSVARVEDTVALRDILSTHGSRNSHVYPILCASDQATRLLKIAMEVGGIADALYDNEVIDWLPIGKKDWLSLYGDYSKVDGERARQHLEQAYGPQAARFIMNEARTSSDDEADHGDGN